MNALTKTQFILASKDEAQSYISQAKEWYNYDKGNMHFENVAGVAVRLIAEYIANNDGKTLYKDKV